MVIIMSYTHSEMRGQIEEMEDESVKTLSFLPVSLMTEWGGNKRLSLQENNW